MRLRDMMKIHDVADNDVAKLYDAKCSIRSETWLFNQMNSWQDIMDLDFVEAIMLLRRLLKAKQLEEGCQWWKYGVEKRFVEKEEVE
tara:strand:+ start:42 stop:302 length:261 start_codon:yes stop_codon:yes gene_type:complete